MPGYLLFKKRRITMICHYLSIYSSNAFRYHVLPDKKITSPAFLIWKFSANRIIPDAPFSPLPARKETAKRRDSFSNPLPPAERRKGTPEFLQEMMVTCRCCVAGCAMFCYFYRLDRFHSHKPEILVPLLSTGSKICNTRRPGPIWTSCSFSRSSSALTVWPLFLKVSIIPSGI